MWTSPKAFLAGLAALDFTLTKDPLRATGLPPSTTVQAGRHPSLLRVRLLGDLLEHAAASFPVDSHPAAQSDLGKWQQMHATLLTHWEKAQRQ
jgi:hypothetical protein